MWEREWLEGKITEEQALKRAGEVENTRALLRSIEKVSQFEVKTYVPKEKAWELLEEKILAGEKSKVIPMPRRYWMIGVAASFILAIGALFLFSPSLLNSDQSEITANLAQTREITLPCGSVVQLNADSKVVYSEKSWNESRDIRLYGEAFFEVEKGSRFTVTTDLGSVEVLGTSFNVRARNGRLEVVCKTGKVKVTSPDGQNSQIITPGLAVTAENEAVSEPQSVDIEQAGSWMSGDFDFESTPLTEVLEEFQRQFDIELKYNPEAPEIRDRIYNGYFHNGDMGEAIQLICNPMGLRYEIEEDAIKILSR